MPRTPEATLVSGATDVGLWVTKFMRDIGPMIFIGGIDGLHEIVEADGVADRRRRHLHRGARARWCRASRSCGAVDRIGGEQVRNMGTIGGNIANGSPIGDTPPPLIALGATADAAQGRERRRSRSKISSSPTASRTGSRASSSRASPCPAAGRREVRLLQDHQAARRGHLGALRRLPVCAGEERHGDRRASPWRHGGDAEAGAAVEAALVGKPWTRRPSRRAAGLRRGFQPLTDMRASAEYRLLAAQNLLRRFFLETTGQGERLTAREVA
jgi:xanthine dehydrogenase small subunit